MEHHIEKVRLKEGEIEIRYPLYKILYRGRSKYQKIEVVESIFGKMLILDGVIQLTTYDEEIYHKGLVCPTYRKKYKKILILGGGDGGAANQLVNLNPEIQVDVVDIDPMVTEVMNRYIPEVIRNVFELDNVRLINQDAFKYVKEYDGKYDMILGDLTDIRYEDEEGSEVNALYSTDYLNDLKRVLNPEGVVTYHVGGLNMDRDHIITVYKTFREVFKHVRVYGIHIPSFLDTWCYITGSDKPIKISRRYIAVSDMSNLLGI